MTKLKICGFKNIDSAVRAFNLGVDYIGLICHPDSKRYVERETLAEIAKQVINLGAIPVAVFVNHTAEQMLALCKLSGIRHVQLHGDVSREQHVKLPGSIARIYVLPINEQGGIVNNIDPNLNPERDYLLFDGLNAGSGTTIQTKNLTKYAQQFRYFLAGGLNQTNLKDTLKQSKPYAIDIASGSEDLNGDKDLTLIRSLTAIVKPEVYTNV